MIMMTAMKRREKRKEKRKSRKTKTMRRRTMTITKSVVPFRNQRIINFIIL